VWWWVGISPNLVKIDKGEVQFKDIKLIYFKPETKLPSPFLGIRV